MKIVGMTVPAQNLLDSVYLAVFLDILETFVTEVPQIDKLIQEKYTSLYSFF